MTEFVAETYQNEYLAEGATEVNAIVTVTSAGSDVVGSLEAAEIVIVDMSGSMGHPRTKLAAAKRATNVAIERIRDGVWFGLIAGSGNGHVVYPATGLARANESTRAEAKAAFDQLSAQGGTAIGKWLLLARERLAPFEGAIRHSILLTDGRDEGETREQLDDALSACEGVFQCDCRGVGTDWQVSELRHIANRLLGTVDMIAEPSGLPSDFDAMMRAAMGKRTADVRVRLWTPRGAVVRVVRQVAPELVDLTPHAVRIDERTLEFPTGAWGDESRDYHVTVSVEPGSRGEEMLAGRISLVVDGLAVSQSMLRAIWTDDAAMTTSLNPRVAHYTGRVEQAQAIADGLQARRNGDPATAAAHLGRATQLAHQAGDSDALARLGAVVDIDDAATGTVRLKKRVDTADEMVLDTRSTKTTRLSVAP